MNFVVSVVLPVYNGEKYLSEAIESILTQTYKNFELIIINDGSTDSTLGIIKKYADIDKRIVIISRENRGLVYSLNEGMEKSSGKYIIRMDADDICILTRFEEQIDFMEQNPEVCVCGSWIELFGENRKNKIGRMAKIDEELRPLLLFSVTVMHPSVILRKNTLDKYSQKYNDEYKHAEDYKMWVDMSRYGKFSNIQKVLLRYRTHESNTTKLADEKEEERYKIISKISDEILKLLGLNLTEQERRLHFEIGLNSRLEKSTATLMKINNYLKKLIDANQKTDVFNQKYLTDFLARKLLIAVFYKIKHKKLETFNALFMPLYWRGVLNEVKNILVR